MKEELYEIPHVIHYCWFGGGEKPDVVCRCIDSWKRFFPEWEIIEWNEENYDITKSQYMREAYKEKKWAFVSDYARFDILYNQGGVYLDVDVEFLKPLPDEYLHKGAFTGFEYTGIVAPGLIFAVPRKHPFLREVLEMFDVSTFSMNADGTFLTVNMQLTNMMKKEGLKTNNKLQNICGVTVYPSEFFCGYNTDIREPEITENTICRHHYLGSWSKPTIKMKLQNILKRLIGVSLYKKLLRVKRRLTNGMWEQE